jgi:hypothetical protein
MQQYSTNDDVAELAAHPPHGFPAVPKGEQYFPPGVNGGPGGIHVGAGYSPVSKRNPQTGGNTPYGGDTPILNV